MLGSVGPADSERRCYLRHFTRALRETANFSRGNAADELRNTQVRLPKATLFQLFTWYAAKLYSRANDGDLRARSVSENP